LDKHNSLPKHPTQGNNVIGFTKDAKKLNFDAAWWIIGYLWVI
jgi:hypothetical protein